MSDDRFFTRQRIISTVIALLILGFAVMYSNKLKDGKKQPEQRAETQVPNVIYSPIDLVNKSVVIQSNGVLEAKNKIDIVSRAQGIFERSDRPFRSGVAFSKGQVMVSIDNDEFVANLRASKAQLLQSLTSVLADLNFDFPDAHQKWNDYVQNFDVNGRLAELPKPSTDREKAFINGKNIVTQYYNIKSQEVKGSYYRIRAPFSGILSSSTVNKGALINAGQKLGTLIDPSVYEMEVKINPQELDLISEGKVVELSNSDNSKTWQAKVTRINKVIDAASQSALAVVEVRGKELREGMFLRANISTKDIENVAELPRSLLIDEKYIFLIKDSTLVKQEVKLIHIADKYVYVSGLELGTWVLQKVLSGAYDGMKVNPISLSE